MAITSAAAVANEFLDLQAADNSSYPPIDQMKIQKLVYYAHAWWLAYKGEPLFDDDIQAWPWGPVIPNVYGEFKHCGRAPLTTERMSELVRIPDTGKFRIEEPQKPPQEVRDFIASVWKSHKGLSGIQLSNSTHSKDEPWTIVKEQYGNLDEKPRIPNELIQQVFKAKLQKVDA